MTNGLFGPEQRIPSLNALIIQSDFRPAWWLRGPHGQTLWPSLVRRISVPPVRRERLELLDGDFLDLDWLDRNQTKRPIVLVLHGLEGSIQSGYAAGILHALKGVGLRAVLMHFRGCSGEPNRLPRNYHSGETGDLQNVIEVLLSRYPGIPLAVVGYSLGGNVLLKWLGEQGSRAPIATAVAVSVPFVLARAADRLDHGFSRLYRSHLLRRLHRSYRQKFRTRPGDGPVPIKALRELRTFRRFDDKITAPLHGFADVNDYYRRASSRPFLKHIQISTLILQAADDPFMTVDAIPVPEELSSCTTLELSERGGHVGFVTGQIPGFARYWLEERIVQHLQSAFATPAEGFSQAN